MSYWRGTASWRSSKTGTPIPLIRLSWREFSGESLLTT